jgi:hypothetical protein
VGASHVHVEQVTNSIGHDTPPEWLNGQLQNLGACVFFFFKFCGCSFNHSGGGEVSGGGTLYMKWGAGLFGLRRECEARAGVKHTLT